VDALLSRLRERISREQYLTDLGDITLTTAYPPVSARDITEAERQLGFPLPSLLRRIYCEIANGGIGPGYGLLGIADGARDDLGHTLVELYQLYHQPDPDDPQWAWPDALVPICHWGCAIYSCIDCRSADAPVLIFDPNGHVDGSGWADALLPHSTSLVEWMSLWLDGINLWSLVYGTPESTKPSVKQAPS